MALRYKILFLFFFSIILTNTARSLHVNVLLREIHSDESVALKISCSDGIIIKSASHEKRQKKFQGHVTIEVHEGEIFIDHKKLVGNQDLTITSLGACSTVDNDRCYEGTLYLIHYGDAILLINKLPLEDYVCSVLKTESWPGWPLEVNKVFAIASRSYVLAKILEARASKLPYHIKNTNIHQTYTGFHTDPILRQAVDETKGIVLSYNHKPIIAMFDCCCGGIIPAHIEGVNHNHVPYLARDYACTFCKDCKLFNWKKELGHQVVYDILKKELPELTDIHEIRVSRFDKAGIAKQVAIKDKKKTYLIEAKKFYSIFKEIVSFCFSITKKKNSIIIEGKGYGHHRGLCQWGARYMVKEGWDFKSILNFFYPGTNFMKIKTSS